MKKLDGKVAVVTGTSKGVGASIAEHLAAEGASVVVNYSSSKGPADSFVARIKSKGGHAIAVCLDRKGEMVMAIISQGFSGRRSTADVKLPPGQYLTTDFPVLSAGPTPHVSLENWQLTIDDGSKVLRKWDWNSFRDLPNETFTVDLHCVTRWSKFGTSWEGVSLDTLLAEVKTDASYAFVHSYGDYTTNLPLKDLLNKQAWIAFRFDGEELAPEHGGPARLLVPHLYLWKSAKWIRRITLAQQDKPGFWETLGYHNYGDPWQEQRYWGE